MGSFALHAVPGDPRALAPFIVAEASGVVLHFSAAAAAPPSFLFTVAGSEGFQLQETLAICRYIASSSRRTREAKKGGEKEDEDQALYHTRGQQLHLQLESWLDWAETELRSSVEDVLAGGGGGGGIGGNFDRVEIAFEKIAVAVQGSSEGFIIGKALTVVDIVVWSEVFPLLADTSSTEYLALNSTVSRWFRSMGNLDYFLKGADKALAGSSPEAMIETARAAAQSTRLLPPESNGLRSLLVGGESAALTSPVPASSATSVHKASGSAILATREHRASRIPIPGKRNVMVTSALPYVNNVPHLGNIIGCVLSADVYARYCRRRGYNVIYMCGTDEYGTATETKALEEGLTPKEICDKYHAIHKDIYEWFDIDFDKFGRTSTPQQTEIAQAIFLKLYEKNRLRENTMIQPYCNTCKRFLADRLVEGTCPMPGCGYEDARGDQCDKCGKLLNAEDLINPRCKVCGNPPVTRETDHLFLDLPELKNQLEEYVTSTSVAGGWSSNSIQTTNAWIRDGLKERCITRDLKWGVPVPLERYKEKVFYVWFDAPIGYISITANYTSEWEKWWKSPNDVELVQFMGKDNVPFHTVIFPCTLLGTGDPWTLMRTISVTEYLNYESGKFSKSRGVGVFGNDVKTTNVPVEVWRYYLLTNRPEVSDTLFTWLDLQAKQNNELLKNLGNFVHRTLSFLAKPIGEGGYGKVVPEAANPQMHELTATFGKEVQRVVKEYLDAMEKVRLKAGLKAAMNASSLGNLYLQDSKFWKLYKEDPPACAVVLKTAVGLVHLLATLLEPFMPSFSHKVLAQLNLPPSTLSLVEENGDLERAGEPWVLVAAGHTIGSPEPIFSEMKDEEVEIYRKKFAGSQADRAASEAAGAATVVNSEKTSKGKKGVSSTDSKGRKDPAEAKEAAVDVTRLDIRVGVIKNVKKHPDADSLYVEEIDVGEDTPRVVVSGLVKFIPMEQMQNRRVCVLCNLKPAAMRGIKSHAMVLAASNSDHTEVELVTPPEGAVIGERVKFPGFDGQPDDILNPKKKVWETVQPDLHTNANLVAEYKDAPFTTSAGVCQVASIRNGGIK
ncbi:unnamed protein product [Sphagnum troendelagicum]|uniref:methionine--tRNA ligase n=1 Tax=Sphagnum troendelagicum TaxID=128251 RepID=A0ABP0TDN3_9BRYO